MVVTRGRIQQQVLKLAIVAGGLSLFGVAVVAAPFALAPRTDFGTSVPQSAKLAPLGSGPAIQLAKAGAGESEDCVRVTRITGPDGKVYATRGIVCGGAE